MTNKQKLVWRLGKLPTPDELRELVKDKIVTQEEAREILFNFETEEERDKKSLESEIKFLRELVEKLAKGRDRIIETIREVKVPYIYYRWYKPYEIWCENNVSNNVLCANATYTNSSESITVSNFSDIKTF